MNDQAHTSRKLNEWVHFQACGAVAAVGLYVWFKSLTPFLVWNLLAFGWLAYWLRRDWKTSLFPGGLANGITWVRLFLFLSLIPGRAVMEGWQLSLVAWMALSLDGLDGLAARRLKQQSDYGEYFDKEADAVFVLTMSLLLYDLGQAGSWVLWFGLIRYVYLVPELWLKPVYQKDRKTTYAKRIAGMVMASLATAPALPAPVNSVLLPAAGLLLAYSFGRSLVEAIADRIGRAKTQ
ncbi:MAG: CDP-alcohol phosphatidyltransferase family protein [Haliscomenobacter sp.]|nr:CDP-alcohol phosphatidyltransferase family protein [Haliscomenobacter sp.]MBK7476291.1 CDP-alcohol phosphatidyltransferase family protein [Haliscomenobacter sp.]MBK8879156.1 CDP-alcohol phosphatidyltransferase family protein [Haliscomenobacter sp.]